MYHDELRFYLFFTLIVPLQLCGQKRRGYDYPGDAPEMPETVAGNGKPSLAIPKVGKGGGMVGNEEGGQNYRKRFLSIQNILE